MLRSVLGWWREVWHSGLAPGSLAAFAFAVLCVAIATIVRSALGEVSSASAVFAPYYSATLVAALVGGAQAGSFAAALGAFAAFWFFVPPDWASHAFDREQLVSYFLFAASSVVIIWAAKSYRDLLWRLRDEQDRRQLLNHELAHRIKNMLAIMQSIISQTLRDQPAALDKLSKRIAALAATNDLLTKSEWRGALFKEILASEFAPYEPSRFELRGTDFACPSELATVLALIFHELTTNAAKYGALSVPRGRIVLLWVRHGERIDIDWVEVGGPPPAISRCEGFGTTLLRKGLRQFDGSVDSRFAPNGLHCLLSLSLPAASQGTIGEADAAGAAANRPPDAGSDAASSVGPAAAHPKLALQPESPRGRK
jgi:two-component sensor histidine kinase